MKTFNWPEVRRVRLARNHLSRPVPKSKLLDVVGRVGGIQAQILSAAELALGVRVAGVTRRDLERELWERRRLVKTYGPRGTLHLLPAIELPMWMAAMRARESLQQQPWHLQAGLNRKQSEKILEAIGKALDGRCLTREELAREVAQQIGGWAKEKLASTWGELLGPAAYAGLLCFGPSQGSRVTFVRADQWVANWADCEPIDSLLEVLRRYIGTYGPVTGRDFARWFWLPPRAVDDLFEKISDELKPVDRAGESAWVLTSNDRLPKSESTVQLIPQYDCYILGSNPRDSVVPAEVKSRIFGYGRGKLEGAVGLPLVLRAGLIAGIWERRQQGNRINLKVELFSKFNSQQLDELESQVKKISDFMEMEIDLSFGGLV